MTEKTAPYGTDFEVCPVPGALYGKQWDSMKKKQLRIALAMKHDSMEPAHYNAVQKCLIKAQAANLTAALTTALSIKKISSDEELEESGAVQKSIAKLIKELNSEIIRLKILNSAFATDVFRGLSPEDKLV